MAANPTLVRMMTVRIGSRHDFYEKSSSQRSTMPLNCEAKMEWRLGGTQDDAVFLLITTNLPHLTAPSETNAIDDRPQCAAFIHDEDVLVNACDRTVRARNVEGCFILQL